MPNETALVRQWLPLGLVTARRVAARYRATAQERDDLYELIPLTLWESVWAGVLDADTPVALAMCIVSRRLVDSIRQWIPDGYHAGRRGERRRYLRRPCASFTVLFPNPEHLDAILIARPAEGHRTDPVEIAARLIPLAGLTPLEGDALAALADDRSIRDAASRAGLSVNTVRAARYRAIRKCRANADATLLCLAGVEC